MTVRTRAGNRLPTAIEMMDAITIEAAEAMPMFARVKRLSMMNFAGTSLASLDEAADLAAQVRCAQRLGAERLEQRTLARPARAHDGNVFVTPHRKTHAVQRADTAVDLGEDAVVDRIGERTRHGAERTGVREGATAAELLGRLSAEEIASLLGELGEERHARRIARVLVEDERVPRREQGPRQRRHHDGVVDVGHDGKAHVRGEDAHGCLHGLGADLHLLLLRDPTRR